jgi:hypothetical protein
VLRDKVPSGMLSDVRQANAKAMHLDVWDCVETYTIGTTPCAQAIDHFQIET